MLTTLLKIRIQNVSIQIGREMIFMKNKETTIRETMRLNIIAKRKERNWTQSDLANILKSKKTTIASWEQGLSSPDIDTIAILLKLFDMSFYEFTGIKE